MKKNKLSPYTIIILSFLGVILIGTLLLLLPISTVDNYSLSFIDALFTSTSAVCVTGLLSVSSVINVYTIFGRVIIIILVEIGGLGFVTLVIFIFSVLGLKIGIKDRYLIKEQLNQNNLKGIVRLVRFAVLVTLSFQIVGTIFNMFVFTKDFTFWKALGYSVFHSISAFNNAGFDLLGSTSLIAYKDNILLNLSTSGLIIFGGIGFIVIYDLLKRKRWNKLTIHSKIVIKTTLILLISGTLLLKLTEWNNITWLQAFFQSVSARTAGFSTVDFNTFTNSGILLICFLMYIGASPASTAGGIKTTTLYTLIKYIFSFSKGKDSITYNRKISQKSVAKAFVLIVLSISYIFIIIFLINIIEKFNPNSSVDQYNYFTKIVFEVFSAFGTVGNSMGITANLHWLSKALISLTMFFGRLGPITIISVLNKHWVLESNSNVKYIEEKIIIG